MEVYLRGAAPKMKKTASSRPKAALIFERTSVLAIVKANPGFPPYA